MDLGCHLFASGHSIGLDCMKPAPVPETGTVQMGLTPLTYQLVRSAKRKKTIAFSFSLKGDLIITSPLRTPLRTILAAAQDRAGWILSHRPRPAAELPALGPEILFLGRRLPLHITESSSRNTLSYLPLPTPDLEALRLTIPPHLTEAARRQAIRTRLTRWYKSAAQSHFQDRLNVWGTQLHLFPRQLSITNPRTQWGSCSADNTIRLSWRLMMTAPDLIDYVIVHELCHIPHKHHGPAFWALVESILPDWKTRRRRLQAEGPTLDRIWADFI
jgi:predicted metal-dependent hydrolase